MQDITDKFRYNLKHIILLIFLFILTACSNRQVLSVQSDREISLSTVTVTSIPPLTKTNISTLPLIGSTPTIRPDLLQSTPITITEETSKINVTPEISPTAMSPDYWMSLPIIPVVSQNAREIHQQGIEFGRNPHAFSKVGDCQSISTYFLKNFDLPGFYNLGKYSSLQATIDWFSGSFSRESLSVEGGFNAAAILSPLRADPNQCNQNESPIACEFRLNNPSIAIISLEEWWTEHPENYEKYMRQIIEYSIQNGVVPILSTKADNLEGNHIINQTIARLSLEYDIPLWNFWSAVQSLPNHGLIKFNSSGELDMFHLTHSSDNFFYNKYMKLHSGWSARNLTALQALDAVRRGLFEQQ